MCRIFNGDRVRSGAKLCFAPFGGPHHGPLAKRGIASGRHLDRQVSRISAGFVIPFRRRLEPLAVRKRSIAGLRQAIADVERHRAVRVGRTSDLPI
jgi:hypothetical protein